MTSTEKLHHHLDRMFPRDEDMESEEWRERFQMALLIQICERQDRTNELLQRLVAAIDAEVDDGK